MDSFRRRVMAALATNEIPYVDLGLPSGILWAQYNIGATVPEGDGEYFSWGNIVGHKAGEYEFTAENYNNTPGSVLTANILPDDIDHDAALVNFGSPWRLPTRVEFKELYDNTDNEWTTINGVAGYKFMKKTDHSVFVFFPASGRCGASSLSEHGSSGCYWSASFRKSATAYGLYFNSSSVSPQDYGSRRIGFTVRPVMDTV